MTDRDYLSFALLTIFFLLLYIAYLRRNRDIWKDQALKWNKWLKDETHWNDEEVLNMLTESEKENYRLRREYQIDDDALSG